jgi:hypothetical protein
MRIPFWCTAAAAEALPRLGAFCARDPAGFECRCRTPGIVCIRREAMHVSDFTALTQLTQSE